MPHIKIQRKSTAIELTAMTDAGRNVFFSIDNNNFTRERLLARICGKYPLLQFTAEDQKAFALTGSIGVPLTQLKGFLALDDAERKMYSQPRIPIDSTNNELGMWIIQDGLSNLNVRTAINGDRGCPWPVIKKVIETLQEKNVNKFNLITDLEADPNKKTEM